MINFGYSRDAPNAGNSDDKYSEDSLRHNIRRDVTSRNGLGAKKSKQHDELSKYEDPCVYTNYYLSNGDKLVKVPDQYQRTSRKTTESGLVEQTCKGGRFTGVQRHIPSAENDNFFNPYSYIVSDTARRNTDITNRNTKSTTMNDNKDIPKERLEVPDGHERDTEKGKVFISTDDKNGSVGNESQVSLSSQKDLRVDSVTVALSGDDDLDKFYSTSVFPTVSNSDHVSRDEDAKWLAWMEMQFNKIAGEDGQISLDEFKNALGVKKSFFAERFFTLFDQDASGSIELNELVNGLRMLTEGKATVKLKFLFEVYDVDGNGSIDRDELKTVLKSCMEESSISISDQRLDDLRDVLFDSADTDDSGTITFEELKAELEKHPGVLENLTIGAVQWLKPPSKKKKRRTPFLTTTYILNNLQKIIYIIIYILISLGLAAYAAYSYRNSNGFVIAARICGANLNFNCMLVLLLMLRKSFTFIMMTPFARILPIDHYIVFHKAVGYMILFYGTVHTVTHICNAYMIELNSDLKMWEVLFTTKAGVGYVMASAFITGWLLVVVLTVMVIFSLEFVRRNGYFQLFYWTHMLYIPFWILVLLHGPVFWKWFLAPGVIFLFEKISRAKFIKRARFGKTYIQEINLLPSGVIQLVVSRPNNFRYKPGDYVNIQIPVIAKYEWHPITISSAPEMKGVFWLHIRALGHWTNRLYEYFEEFVPEGDTDYHHFPGYTKVTDDSGGVVLRSMLKNDQEWLHPKEVLRRAKNKQVLIEVFIDGPYGTPTREIFQTEHAVLIGAGIGITPMASILQSAMYRFKEALRRCPNCNQRFYEDDPENVMKLKKVDFVWVNRDQKSFEWFVTLLTKLEIEQSQLQSTLPGEKIPRIMDLHLFMTSAQKKTDMRGIGLQMALDLMHVKEDKDLITGLKARTQPGRPEWSKLLSDIDVNKRGRVKVFFCGAPVICKSIKKECERLGFGFSKEDF